MGAFLRSPVAWKTNFVPALRSLPGSCGLVLLGMLLVDFAFIVVSADQDFRGTRTSLHVSVDNGIAEHFQYVKWGALAVMLGVMALRKRASIYFIWGLLFLYLLIDDSQQIHETYGILIANALALPPAFGLRAQDFGELIVTAIACVPLLGSLALAYFFGARGQVRTFTHTMIGLLVALAFFGVGVDMLDIMVPWTWLAKVLNLIEDGGEMIVATFMVGYAAASLIEALRPAAEFAWLREPWGDPDYRSVPDIHQRPAIHR